MRLSFTQDKVFIRIGEKVLKTGGDSSVLHVDINSIIGTRILVTFRERIPHKAFSKRKELAIAVMANL